jgi:hypothetical protein
MSWELFILLSSPPPVCFLFLSGLQYSAVLYTLGPISLYIILLFWEFLLEKGLLFLPKRTCAPFNQYLLLCIGLRRGRRGLQHIKKMWEDCRERRLGRPDSLECSTLHTGLRFQSKWQQGSVVLFYFVCRQQRTNRTT